MKCKYSDEKLKLCYMDMDSLIYDIETSDFYEDISGDVENRFDTGSYKDNRPLPVVKKKKVIGLKKDELGGDIMTELVTLRPKMYSYWVRKEELKKCKGIMKCIVWKMISFKDYKKCLFEGEVSYRSQIMFRFLKHEVKMLGVNKLALSRKDDKGITVDGISSLA